MGTLFVVATPIGNLEDMTARAIRVLAEVTLIAVEDTRRTGRLLAHFGIDTPMISYHAFNERSRRERLLSALAEGDVALASDAGTPGISDPGVDLVDAALEAGFAVRTVPGASSLAAAASVSGMLDGPFSFLGFLPRKATERAGVLGRAVASGFGLILFEAPSRTRDTILEIARLAPGRRYAIARELTKLHEEIARGVLDPDAELSELAEPRGEVVIVIEGSKAQQDRVDDPDDVLAGLLRAGLRPSDAAKEAARMTGRPRSELYARALAIGKSAPAE